MSTTAGRIRWILKEKGITQRELARRAHLGETHVNMVLRRLDANPDAHVESRTMRAIAKAADVPQGWLENGPVEGALGPVLRADPVRWAAIRKHVLEEHPDLEARFVDMAGNTPPAPDAPRELGIAWVVAVAREYQSAAERERRRRGPPQLPPARSPRGVR